MITNSHYYKVVPVTTPESDTLKVVLYYAGPNIVRVSFCHDLKELQNLQHYANIVGYEEAVTNEIAEDVICELRPDEIFKIAGATNCRVLANNEEYGLILFGEPKSIEAFKGLMDVKNTVKRGDVAQYKIYQVNNDCFSVEITRTCNKLHLDLLQDVLDILGFKDKTPED